SPGFSRFSLAKLYALRVQSLEASAGRLSLPSAPLLSTLNSPTLNIWITVAALATAKSDQTLLASSDTCPASGRRADRLSGNAATPGKRKKRRSTPPA